MDVLEECGHSDRCGKCGMRRQEMQFGTMSHSAGCRKRMEALVAGDQARFVQAIARKSQDWAEEQEEML